MRGTTSAAIHSHELRRLVLPSSLTVSVVTYHSDRVLLERCLSKLAVSIGAAREDGVVKSVAVALIDNSEDGRTAEEVIRLGKLHFADSGCNSISCMATRTSATASRTISC